MNCKRKPNNCVNPSTKRNKASSPYTPGPDAHREQNETFNRIGCIDIIHTDTEAAVQFVKKTLMDNDWTDPFPPVVFVHQLYDIVENKTNVNRQLERLRNEKKIILIHLGNEESMKVILLFEDLKRHVIQNCTIAETLLYNKFFDRVLSNTTDIGISRADLLVKFRFSEKDIRFLVNVGLLILRETGIFWFSFPSAGTFMKKLLKGRQVIINIIRKRKFHEILQSELEKIPFRKQISLPMKYHIHDLVGGNFVKCFQTSSGRLLRSIH